MIKGLVRHQLTTVEVSQNSKESNELALDSSVRVVSKQ